jgi:hypothetical protein
MGSRQNLFISEGSHLKNVEIFYILKDLKQEILKKNTTSKV